MLGRKMFHNVVLIVVAMLAVTLAAGCSAVSRPAVSAGVQAVPAGGGPSGSQPVTLIGQPNQPVVPANRGITSWVWAKRQVRRTWRTSTSALKRKRHPCNRPWTTTKPR